MPDNTQTAVDLLRIQIPGPISVDILGADTITFDAPVLRLSGVDSLEPDQMRILEVMMKLISQLNPEQQ